MSLNPTGPHALLARRLEQLGESGQRTPCASEPERWIGEDAAARAFAVFECIGGCPLLTDCRAAGVNETHGVWGGIDRSKATRKRRAA